MLLLLFSSVLATRKSDEVNVFKNKISVVADSDTGCASWLQKFVELNPTRCTQTPSPPPANTVVTSWGTHSVARKFGVSIYDARYTCRVDRDYSGCDKDFLRAFSRLDFFMLCPSPEIPGKSAYAQVHKHYLGYSDRVLVKCHEEDASIALADIYATMNVDDEKKIEEAEEGPEKISLGKILAHVEGPSST